MPETRDDQIEPMASAPVTFEPDDDGFVPFEQIWRDFMDDLDRNPRLQEQWLEYGRKLRERVDAAFEEAKRAKGDRPGGKG